MSKVATVVFDGQVLRPNASLDLEPGKHYVITIEAESATVTIGDAWDVLEALAGTVEAPLDWSIEHDHYLYGTPKHQPEVDHDSTDKRKGDRPSSSRRSPNSAKKTS